MKRILLILTVLMAAGSMHAQNSKLSPSTWMMLKTEARQGTVRKAADAAPRPIDTFLRLNEGYDASEIESHGVKVVNRFGQLLTVRIPLDKIEAVGMLPSVKSINVGNPVRLFNDSARIYTRADVLQQGGSTTEGISLGQQYTGKGVIVGMIDGGFEFNHINFMDANGKSRVKMVYLGSEDKLYTDPDEIARLTTDNPSGTHGTHTSGIAAGGYTKNGYQGMAPDADLLLFAYSTSHFEASVINSLATMIAYADSVGKPLSVNMSIGSLRGAHDGTDEFNQAFNSLKGNGHLISISSANEGTNKSYIKHVSTNADYQLQFSTILYSKDASNIYLYFDLWNRSSNTFQVQLAVAKKSDGTVLAETPLYPDSVKKGESAQIIDSVSLAKYYKGAINFASQLSTANNRYQNIIAAQQTAQTDSSDYQLILKVYSKKGEIIEGHAEQRTIYFTGDDALGYIGGNDSCAVNNWIYNDNSISVGAYVSKQKFYSATQHNLREYIPGVNIGDTGDMAFFSSYGIKDDGTALPFIIAPGSVLVSSYNSSVRNRADSAGIVDSLVVGDKTYYWGADAGTSMASPVVTGIMAQWLQYKPTLSIDEVKGIMEHTAIVDDYVRKYNFVKSGHGKIDAYAGLKYMLTTNIGNPQCAQHQVLIYPSGESGKINIYAQGESGTLQAAVYSAAGVKVFSDNLATTDGSATLQLGSRLAPGVYIVKVEGAKAKGSNTLTVR